MSETPFWAPGAHENIPDDEYHRLPWCSKHALDVILDHSPAHLRYQRAHPPEPTPAMRFGSALHCAVLEPERFAEQYAILRPCAATLTSGRRKGEACGSAGAVCVNGRCYCRTHEPDGNAWPSDRTLALADAEAITRMQASLREHQAAHALLCSPGRNELTLLWEMPVGDNKVLRCKARVDGIRPDWDTAFDLKTAADASKSQFERAMAMFRYHAQAWYYLEGLRACGIPLKHFVFVVVEKEPPYAVATYRLTADAVDAGRQELASAIAAYTACQQSDFWPGYCHEFQDISLPPWRMRQIINSALEDR